MDNLTKILNIIDGVNFVDVPGLNTLLKEAVEYTYAKYPEMCSDSSYKTISHHDDLAAKIRSIIIQCISWNYADLEFQAELNLLGVSSFESIAYDIRIKRIKILPKIKWDDIINFLIGNKNGKLYA